MRASRGVIGLLAVLGASCAEDPGLTCVNGYVLDGTRCVFRDYATGAYDAGVSEPIDAGAKGPADASPCDASAADDAASEDAAPCTDAAADEDEPGE